MTKRERQYHRFYKTFRNFGIFIPDDIARDSKGNPYTAVAGPAITITITKESYRKIEPPFYFNKDS